MSVIGHPWPLKELLCKAGRLLTVAPPLGQSVVHVDDPGCVEYVTCRFESRRYLGRRPEVEQRRKSEPHVSSFISNGRTTVTANDFAGKDSLGLVQTAIEESQAIEPRFESDVGLMKDGGPLHRRTMQLLAHDAVTDLRVHGIGGDAVPHRPAMATRFVSSLKAGIIGSQE